MHFILFYIFAWRRCCIIDTSDPLWITNHYWKYPTTGILQDQSFFFFSVTPKEIPPISGTKRGTGDALVSKGPVFRGLFWFSRISFRIYECLDLGNSVLFLGFWAIFRERKGLPEICWCQDDQNFEGFSEFQKQLNFRIFVFLYFLLCPPVHLEVWGPEGPWTSITLWDHNDNVVDDDGDESLKQNIAI